MRFLSAAVAILFCIGSTTASASTVRFQTDAQLIAQSDRVVHGRAIGQRTTRGPDGRTIYTVTTLAIIQDLTGVQGDTVDVWEQGGTIGGESLHVPGGVVFELGREVVVCLRGGRVGLYTLGMGLSRFDVVRTPDGHARLVRQLGDTLVLGGTVSTADQSLEEFRLLAQQVTGRTARVGGASDAPVRRPAGQANFTYVGDIPPAPTGGTPGARWVKGGAPVLYYIDPAFPPPVDENGQPKFSDLDAVINTAMTTWTNPPNPLNPSSASDASIVLQYLVSTTPTAESVLLRFDNDKDGEEVDEIDPGVLAVTSVSSVDDASAHIRGTVFKRLTGAVIHFQNYDELPDPFKENSDLTKLVAHEVGHTIGLGHTQSDGSISDAPRNLMSSSCCTFTPPPPALGVDDLRGLVFLYPAGDVCKYVLNPSNNTVSSSGGTLTLALTTYASCAWTAQGHYFATPTVTSGIGPALVSYVVAPNVSQTRSEVVTVQGQQARISQASNLPTISLDKTELFFGAVTSGATFLQKTSTQVIRLTKAGAGPVTWRAQSNDTWLTVTPASGNGTANLLVSVDPAGGLSSPDSLQGSITMTYEGATVQSRTIKVGLRLMPSGTSLPAFGYVDTPQDNATGLTGAVPVTGWALDDVEIAAVSICRGPVLSEAPGPNPRCGGWAQLWVADAVFIDGARPDVLASHPGYPRNTQGGWGLMLLTNMLPGQGNGTFTFSMWARDPEGHSTLLGTRTLTGANDRATAPFGTIDTPAQGETISGNAYVSFGWALTQQPKEIPTDGSTLMVYVDGQAVGQPSYGHYREDIATLFPGLKNSNGAIGYRVLDTTALSNGLHTIEWTATDSGGNAAGLGSRYFTASNGSAITRRTDAATSALAAATSDAATLAAVPVPTTALMARRGWAADAPWRRYQADATGRVVVHGEELDRFELRLGAGVGYLRVGTALQPLPIGSGLDPETGVFTWGAGVGFIGTYDLVFVGGASSQPTSRREVRIVLRAKGAGAQVVIDMPTTGQSVDGMFTVAGWAADLRSVDGPGIDTLHVWAYPVSGGAPVFLGVTAVGGARPDVAAAYGEEFRDAGYGLVVSDLEPGAYDVAVFGWSRRDNGFLPASVARITVR